MLSDAAALAARPIKAAIGQKTNFGRNAVNFAGRYTSVLSCGWATRGAYRRLFLDQLQWLVDPDADKSFKARAGNLERSTGQGYYWPPGQALPDRGATIAPQPGD